MLAGPRSREVLAKLTDAPLDNAAFPWLTGQVAEVGLATDVYLLRVNFVGALGWELHFPIEYAHHLFDAHVRARAAEFNIGMAGMRAMESLRMEKSYRMWGTDLTPDYTPFEAGLDRFVRMNKGAFIGKEALEKQLAAGRPAPLRHASKCTASSTPIRSATSRCSTCKGTLIGRATAGYYGHALRQEPGMGYVKPEFAAVGSELQIEILGERKRATVLVDSPYDPENKDFAGPGWTTRNCMSRQAFSALALIRRGLSGHRSWQPQWRKAEPQAELRCGHRRRRRSRPGRRLLPRRRSTV